MTTSTIPDTDRTTTYTIVSPTVGPLSCGFDIFCDDDDLAEAAVQVWDDGVQLTATTHYTLSSASGDDLSGIARPITDAQITFVAERSGEIIIIGARRPRRPVGYDNGSAIPASKHNYSINDVFAMLRELWELRDRMFLAKAGQSGGTIDTLVDSVIANYSVTPYMATVLLAADAVTARTALGLDTLVGGIPQGRLTLTSGTAITTTDVTGATVSYYTPASGGMIPLYNGTDFIPTAFTELSNDTTASSTGKAGPAAVAASKVYYLMVWSDSGTLRLTRSPAWTSDTNPGTGAGTAEIEFVKGVPVNKVAITNGPAAQRGTIVAAVRSNASSQLVDSEIFRWVSNIYNAVPRTMKVVDTTNSWNYATATFRQARATAANQLDFLQALDGNALVAMVNSIYSNSDTGQFGIVGIDIDSVNTTALVNNVISIGTIGAANQLIPCSARYNGYPGKGRHVAIWKEYGSATGTGTFVGDNGSSVIQSGIYGEILN